MRTNRTKKESFSDGSTADKQMCRPRSKEVTSLQSSTKQSSSSVPIKKNLPRRKKARTYRVRRVDFYDYRSQIVIKNRLRIPYLLNRELATETNNGSAHILPLKMCDLPSKLCEKSFKPRLRTHGNSPNSGVDKEFDLSLLLKNTKDVHQHISLLLTTPHTFVGQRLSQDGRCEFLIRWIHGSGQNTIPPTWISEEELQMAAHLDYSL
ncbi:unnamed protein product [Heterobilharzia americana]|nr:unnamed protein product [Heterobilharzia americana]